MKSVDQEVFKKLPSHLQQACIEHIASNHDDATSLEDKNALHSLRHLMDEKKPHGKLATVWRTMCDLHDKGMLIYPAIGVPLRHLLAVGGLVLCCTGGCDRRTAMLAVALWPVSGIGVTAGVHRLWTHSSYKASPALEFLLMCMFSVADQGPIGAWALTHMMHHRFSDTDRDPHNRAHGFYYSHLGWVHSGRTFIMPTEDRVHVLSRLSRIVHWHDQHSVWWDPLWSLGMPALVASLWGAALAGFLVAGALRWLCVQHITFCVNSIAHGPRTPGTDRHAFHGSADTIGPRPSLIVTILALGEGWHDYHHVRRDAEPPALPSHSLYPWDYAAAELDAWDQWNPTKAWIDACAALGLCHSRRRCSSAHQLTRRRQLEHGLESRVILHADAAERTMSEPPRVSLAEQYRVVGPLFLRRRERVPPPAKTARAE